MRLLWNYLSNRKSSLSCRRAVFLAMTTFLGCCVGGAFWALLHLFLPVGLTLLICLVGYVGFFPGFVGGILYLYRC